MESRTKATVAPVDENAGEWKGAEASESGEQMEADETKASANAHAGAEREEQEDGSRPGRGQFRCEDCRFAVLCSSCVVREHMLTPFHRIEVRWRRGGLSKSAAHENGAQTVAGRFWGRVQRKSDIGIELQLVHNAGEACFMPHARKNFSIVHTNGIHRMSVNFCRCRRGVHLDDYTQLLRARLWPATIDDPETATTYEAMNGFNRLSMLGRLSGFDYYKAMQACTDAVGLLNIAVSTHKTCAEFPLTLASPCTSSSLGALTNSDTSSCSSGRGERTRAVSTAHLRVPAPLSAQVVLAKA